MSRVLALILAALIAGCGRPADQAPAPAASAPAPAPAESAPEPASAEPAPVPAPATPPALVATTLLDSASLRYHLLQEGASASQGMAGPALKSVRVDSAAQLQAVLAAGAVPAAIPADLGQLPVPDKKSLFFGALAPIVSFHNAAIASRRRRLEELAARDRLAAGQRRFVAAMTELYPLPAQKSLRDSLQVLLLHVDRIPPSLALAQAAIESGWGSSRFSRQGRNLYGQRVWGGDARGLRAEGAQDARFRLAVFPTISASVRSYMHNLNTHPAYAGLRRLRAQARRGGEVADGPALAAGLERYSTRGEEYVADVLRMIRTNDLARLDRGGKGQ